MPLEGIPTPKTMPDLGWALLVVLVGALSRFYKPATRKEKEENAASLQKNYLDGDRDIRATFKQILEDNNELLSKNNERIQKLEKEVEELKQVIMEQATRHTRESAARESEHAQEIRDIEHQHMEEIRAWELRYEELEEKYHKSISGRKEN